MASNVHPPATRIALQIPVIVLVLAATVIPVELRAWGASTISFSGFADDILENIAGFVPVGIVLAELGWLRAVAVAALISTLAEACQLFMAHRDPSVIDVASNVVGGMIGAFVATRWKIRSPEIPAGKRIGALAALLAVLLVLGVRAWSGAPVSARGATSPGILEACWNFDEGSGTVALDASTNQLSGSFRHQPRRVAGVHGGAISFDGAKDSIDFGHSAALRLAGSMTISAWINSSSFPADDAAIVSQLQSDFGFQLDTTIDKGPRTIGFKLTNACGVLMARYGATPLRLHAWYHVTGVYDAGARTMDVYLNGKLDDGALVGVVSGLQRSSRGDVYVGRRSDLTGYEFAGAVDEVRIYSFALTEEQIIANMQGEIIAGPGAGGNRAPQRRVADELSCNVASESSDARLPGAAATIGALVAIACLGLWPSAAAFACLASSLAAGLLLLPFLSPTLPLLGLCMMPLSSLAGGASIAVSIRRQRADALSPEALQ